MRTELGTMIDNRVIIENFIRRCELCYPFNRINAALLITSLIWNFWKRFISISWWTRSMKVIKFEWYIFINGNQTFDNQLKFNIVKNYCLYTFLTLFWKWKTKEKLYLLEINFNGTTKQNIKTFQVRFIHDIILLFLY